MTLDPFSKHPDIVSDKHISIDKLKHIVLNEIKTIESLPTPVWGFAKHSMIAALNKILSEVEHHASNKDF